MLPKNEETSTNRAPHHSKSKLPPDTSFDVAEWLEAENLEHDQKTRQMGYDSMFDRNKSQSRRKREKP